jgi:protein SCO1/2
MPESTTPTPIDQADETPESAEAAPAGTGPKVNRLPILIAAGLLLVIFIVPAAMLAGRLLRQPPQLHGSLLDPPMAAADFTLASADQPQVRLSDFRGKVVLLFFGYTNCPDVCPATLAMAAQAQRLLGPQAGDVQVIMISVDPERDTPRVVGDYVSRFHPAFVGLSGTPGEVAAVTQPYGVLARKNIGVSGGNGYLVDHTGSTLVIDRQGYVRLLLPPTVTGDEMAADLRYVLQG